MKWGGRGKEEMTVSIRVLTAADADAVATMSLTFHHYLRDLGDTDPYHFNRTRYLEDGFGTNPAFGGFLATVGAKPAGYLLHCPGYDVDAAIRQVMVIDLWVDPAARGHGLGRKLMQATADHALATGAKRLFWAVLRGNRLAVDFYRVLGAEDITTLDWMMLDLPVSIASR